MKGQRKYMWNKLPEAQENTSHKISSMDFSRHLIGR